MYRVVIYFLLTLTLLLPDTIHFRENRYIYALNKTVVKTGIITSSEDSLTVAYDKSGQKLLYDGESLTIADRRGTKVIDLNRDIVTKLFFVLLQAVFHNDEKQLKQFFTIESRGSQRILYPRELASGHITKIIYKKSNKLDYLHIYLKNQDRISIEQIH